MNQAIGHATSNSTVYNLLARHGHSVEGDGQRVVIDLGDAGQACGNCGSHFAQA
jgi:hypothetical protein